MMLLLHAEWIRFIRNPINLWVIGVFFMLLASSAIWSGLAANQFREQALQHPVKSASRQVQAEMHDAPGNNQHQHKESSALSVSNTAEPLRLATLGGLALSVRQADLSGTEINISTRSRHTDGRNSDQLFNPLLRELGLLDFATILALLLPLTVIGLTYGLVQEDREKGIWSLVCAQMTRPWLLVFAALFVRLMLVLLPSILASLLSFSLDSGATMQATLHWIAFIAVFTGVWILVSGLFLLLPVSSGAAAVGMLGVWLIATFAVPASLSWAANNHDPMPSRLTTIVDIRQLQEQSSRQRMELLSAWYQTHPEHPPSVPLQELPREIAAMPASLELDSKIRPLMFRFDSVRKAHFEFMERWSPLSPGLATVLMADRLAGIDAERYAEYIQAVNQFEDQWRTFFVPRIMNNKNLSAADYEKLPVFQAIPVSTDEKEWSVILKQLLSGSVLLLLLLVLRKKFGSP